MDDNNEIFKISCDKILEQFSKKEIEEIAERVVKYYRINGFPHYRFTDLEIANVYKRLCGYDVKNLELDDNVLQQAMTGLSVANSFHPGMWSVKCRNAKTPMEVFCDDELFKAAIIKRIHWSDSPLRPFNIRKSLKVFSGAQSVSNFKPTIAKYFYQSYCPHGGTVLDPCAGYGGRLLGAWSSHIGRYVGIDPSSDAFVGNTGLNNKFNKITDTLNDSALFSLFRKLDVQLLQIPFEDYKISEKFDLVFTSPPYFNIEKYSDELTQSYIRYPTYPLWRDGFLKVLIDKSFGCLKNGGFLCLNVAGDKIIKDSEEIGIGIFGTRPSKKYMRLSKIMGSRKKDKASHKLEPILIWKKD